MSFTEIKKCRICGGTHLNVCLDLGVQYLSGIFPRKADKKMPHAPLKLLQCDPGSGGCGHIQLSGTYSLDMMYGENYGYRSGLNSQMINHLKNKAEQIISKYCIKSESNILDIAGNDGTFLGFFPEKYKRLSIDPSSEKFSNYFAEGVDYISDFFTDELFIEKYGNEKADIVTSFSMFYDLDDPCNFASQVRNILNPETGVWVLEQSYMPEMLKVNSFDTICHEHLSYYGIRQLKYIMDKAKLKIIDIEMNDVNGGSCSLAVSDNNSKYIECKSKINKWIEHENDLGLSSLEPWGKLSKVVSDNRKIFFDILDKIHQNGSKIAALGASTKGNVTLQSWNITQNEIETIGDVNSDKWGCFTPGTWIPIQSEDEVLSEYDYFVILPWHFRDFFLTNEKFKGKKLIFPLPVPELITVE